MSAGVKRTTQKAETRRRILGVAQGMFHRRGYDAVNLRQVAKEAGCSTGAIFSSFSDKEQLFEEAMGRKVPMARVRDALVGASERGEVPPWGANGAAELLRDLYGADV